MTKKTRYVLGIGVVLIIGVILAGCKFSSSRTSSSTASEPPGLPPDPGAAGKATLADVDSNNNGVWDREERYIALNYPDKQAQALLMLDAVTMQQELLNATNTQVAVQNTDQEFKLHDCLVYVMGSSATEAATNAVWNLIRNADVRNRAYLAYINHVGNQAYPDVPSAQLASTCDQFIRQAPVVY